MRTFLLLLLVVFSSCKNEGQTTQENNDLTTIYFMRHAEKATDQGADPNLTAQGKKRAQEWVNYFFIKDVDHILSSNYNRTRQTAQPLAQSKKLEVTTYDVNTLTAYQLIADYPGKTIVVYGHSNTINKYANELQNDTDYAELDESDYDHFFIARINKNGEASVTKETMDF